MLKGGSYNFDTIKDQLLSVASDVFLSEKVKSGRGRT